MDLTFQKAGLVSRGKGYTFNDVLLVPNKSDMRSRRDPDLTSNLFKDQKIALPMISANMDTITESAMAISMNQEGGLGILHRFMTIEDQVKQVEAVKAAGVTLIAASIGVNGECEQRSQALVDAGANILTIDIAHGHSVQMLETLEWLRKQFPTVKIIAGNVATAEATRELIEAGADAIKVGIGPGSMCTTRIITGCGVPQLTAIAMCAEEGARHGVPVIARRRDQVFWRHCQSHRCRSFNSDAWKHTGWHNRNPRPHSTRQETVPRHGLKSRTRFMERRSAQGHGPRGRVHCSARQGALERRCGRACWRLALRHDLLKCRRSFTTE
jgi:IMP dehydrogenase/GMP reductase